jgi:hypothetical protein
MNVISAWVSKFAVFERVNLRRYTEVAIAGVFNPMLLPLLRSIFQQALPQVGLLNTVDP